MTLHSTKILLLLGCFLWFAPKSISQSNAADQYLKTEIKERTFDQNQWSSIVKELEYTKDGVKKEAKKDSEFDDLVVDDDELVVDPEEEHFTIEQDGNSGVWATFFKVLIIAFAVIIVALIIANLMRSGEISKKQKLKGRVKTVSKPSLKNIEEKIHETDLERLIKEALANKDYALAIRLYYLTAIKELSLSKKIAWKKDKTNYDYLREINQTNVFQPFREATNIFERVWYGDGQLSETDFQILKPKFQQLVATAKK